MQGAHEIPLAAGRIVDGRPFPLTFAPDEPTADLAAFVGKNRATIMQMVASSGAVLLRGWKGGVSAYPIADSKRQKTSAPDGNTFSAAVAALGLTACDMACSSAPRKPVAPGVYTANEAPPTEKIPFHHEMAQCPSQPTFILFFCEVYASSAHRAGALPLTFASDADERATPRAAQVAPAAGGETPILPSVWAARYLRHKHPKVAEALATRARPQRTAPTASCDPGECRPELSPAARLRRPRRDEPSSDRGGRRRALRAHHPCRHGRDLATRSLVEEHFWRTRDARPNRGLDARRGRSIFFGCSRGATATKRDHAAGRSR